MNYKFLLASDMDYTFLLPSGEVSKANREALLELRDNGIAFTFATGRTHFLVSKYVFDLGIEVPVICSNGGEIFDYKKRKSVFSADFSDKKSRELLKLFFENNIDFTAYNSDAVYFSPRSSRLDFFLKYNEGLSEDEKAVLRNFDADILKSEELSGFNKFLMIESPDDFSSQIYNDSELEVVSSAKGFDDVMVKGSTKGNALHALAKHMGIPDSHVFAIGDNDNDYSMFDKPFNGIAMGNATPILFDVAKYVTSSCEEDGFAKACHDFIIPLARSMS